MSQNSLVVANGAGSAVRAAINNALNTLATLNSGTSAPSTTYADMWWMDTTNSLLKIRNSTNTAWVTIGTRDVVNMGLASLSADNAFTQRQRWAKGTNTASASSVTLPSDGNLVHITGTTTITAFGSVQAGTLYILVFDSAGCSVTHNDTSLILKDKNFVSTAGGILMIVSEGSGNWREVTRIGTSINSMPSPIINGNMEIWQRGTSFSTGALRYTADRWQYGFAGAGAVTVQRSTTVPTVAQAGVLFNYSLEVDVTTADASIAASDQYFIRHYIEGYNWRHFAQREITLSFWVSSPKTGTHSVGLSNSGANRSYVAEYTVNAANTWEYKTITISASPSAGTWDYTNGIGVAIIWTLAAGSTYTTSTLNTWNSDALYASSNQVNALDLDTNFFRLTGVKMELGPVATPIQYKSFQDELEECQRYYEKNFAYHVTPVQNVGIVYYEWPSLLAGSVAQRSPVIFYKVRKRQGVTPSVTLYNPGAANAQVRNLTDSADLSGTSVASSGEDGFHVNTLGTAGTAVGERLGINWSSDSEF